MASMWFYSEYKQPIQRLRPSLRSDSCRWSWEWMSNHISYVTMDVIAYVNPGTTFPLFSAQRSCHCQQAGSNVDEGFLEDTHKFPVRKLLFGDTEDSYEYLFYTFGPLRCIMGIYLSIHLSICVFLCSWFSCWIFLALRYKHTHQNKCTQQHVIMGCTATFSEKHERIACI